MKKNSFFRVRVVLPIVYLLFTSTVCEPWTQEVFFSNCTNDTLLIGASQCNNIDGLDYVLTPFYTVREFNTEEFSLKKSSAPSFCFDERDIIFPDSICSINYYCLFDNNKTDTAYFFLIKWSDAKKYSWDEIREQKLYRKWIVTRDKDGNYDTNIRYSDSDEQE